VIDYLEKLIMLRRNSVAGVPRVGGVRQESELTMSNLASRLEEPALRIEAAPTSWMPDEAPLDMPRQSLEECEDLPDGFVPATSPKGVGGRREVVFGATALLTFLVALGPYVLYAREGFDLLELLGFGVFLLLAASICCWFCSGAAGFFVLMNDREQDDLAFSPRPAAPRTRTALLMPLYNEDASAAFARLATIDASLARLGVDGAFDFFVLSDSTRDEVALDEQAAYRAFRTQAHSRVFMRRRKDNTERKAGNISDWVCRFGGAYDFMIVLDADSVMAGETVLRLVDAMERHPGVGLIQTAPTIVGASTLFARVSQFGVRMYGRVAAAGLAWWAGSEASYWGHNAILRTKAFADCAGLPILPGKKPFGGHVLSHDVVEAALMRRAGWAVHVTAALDGSSEETPPTLLDFIRRDHRWCQGNLQHLGVVGARGLTVVSRLQLLMGCMAYVSSLLWFATLALGMAIQLQYAVDWASFWYFLNPQFSPFMLTSLLSGVLLIGPKLMGAVLVLSRRGERRAFGGARTIVRGVAVEILLSALLAPILMIANTKAIVLILSGRDAGWHTQQREADGIGWGDAFRSMTWQMAAGLAFAVCLCFRPDLAVSFAPIVLPLLFAAPLAVLTSRRRTGEAFARKGLLVTPVDHGVSTTPAVLGAVVRPAPSAARPAQVLLAESASL
jgi:membrane glycosyltransferase